MIKHVFQQRLHCRYRQPGNAVAELVVEQYAKGEWRPFELGFGTPGFETFVYALLNCQHLYLRVNAAERGLALASAEGAIEAVADDVWALRKLHVRFEAKLQSGSPSEDDIAYIVDRMRHCPVSTNIREAPDTVVEVRFG